MRTLTAALCMAAAAAFADIRERVPVSALRLGVTHVEIDIADDGSWQAPYVEAAGSPSGDWTAPSQVAELRGRVWTVRVRRCGAVCFYRAWRGRMQE